MLKTLKTIRAKKAFTLVEVLFYSLMVSMMVLVIMSLSLQIVRSKASQAIWIEMQSSADRITIMMEFVLRGATSINSSNSTFNNDDGELELNMIYSGFDPTRFYLDNGNFMYEQGTADAIQLNEANVQVTQFNIDQITYPQSPDSIVVEFTFEPLDNSIYGDISYPFRVSYSLNHY